MKNYFQFSIFLFYRYSSDGAKTNAKAGVKLVYKYDLAFVFTSDGHPMLLVGAKPRQEDVPSEQ